jgi:predicted nucleic acid-binding protein
MFLTPIFMSKYNLLPNDAIILATCKMHNITKLASYDTDFIVPCQEEGIELLREKD